MLMQNSNDTIRNRICDLLACSTVPQPTVPLHTAHMVLQGLTPATWNAQSGVCISEKMSPVWPEFLTIDIRGCSALLK
jgi:hypothetical protein